MAMSVEGVEAKAGAAMQRVLEYEQRTAVCLSREHNRSPPRLRKPLPVMITNFSEKGLFRK
jgi:hypothetical protein